MWNLCTVGAKCREYRRRVLKVSLFYVSRTLGYSRENVSAFENGRNDNCLILLWYLSQGLTVDQIIGGVPIE